MANIQFQCPGNDLEDLVRGIAEHVFPKIFRRPDKDQITKALGNEGEPVFDFPPNLKYEANRLYQDAFARYEEFGNTREKYTKYFGFNADDVKEEDVDGVRVQVYSILRRHVENHVECRDAYLRFLQNEAEAMREQIMQKEKEFDVERVMKNIDRIYLRLFATDTVSNSKDYPNKPR